MSRRSFGAWVVLAVSCVGSAAWAEFRSGEEVVIGRGERVGEDLYAFANHVVIEGEVDGDVVAFAREVDVPGRVEGDLLTAAADVTVGGEVGGSVRAATATFTLLGSVKDDVFVAAREVDLQPAAKIGRDLMAASAETTVRTPVARDARIASGSLELSGPVSNDVIARVGELKITPDARIGGTLRYASEEPAQIAQGAPIGQVVELQKEPAHRTPAALWFLFSWIRWSVGLFVLGVLVRALFPRFTRAVPDTLRRSPWLSLGIGVAVLFGVPAIAAVLIVVGAFVGGWWLGLIAIGLLATAILVAFPMVGLWIGQLLFDRVAHRHVRLVLALLLGVVLLALVVRIPIFGWFVALATVLFGLGALAVAGWRLRPGGRATIPAPA